MSFLERLRKLLKLQNFYAFELEKRIQKNIFSSNLKIYQFSNIFERFNNTKIVDQLLFPIIIKKKKIQVIMNYIEKIKYYIHGRSTVYYK